MHTLTLVVAINYTLALQWWQSRGNKLLMPDMLQNIHPALMAESVRQFRSSVSCAMFTVNPLILNEIEPEFVWLVTPSMRACRMDKTINFKTRAQIYAIGELWLSYADGKEEADLLPSKLRAKLPRVENE